MISVLRMGDGGGSIPFSSKQRVKGEIRLKQAISLSPVAVRQIENILNEGHAAQVKIIKEKRGKRLLVQEVQATKKYDTVIAVYGE